MHGARLPELRKRILQSNETALSGLRAARSMYISFGEKRAQTLVGWLVGRRARCLLVAAQRFCCLDKQNSILKEENIDILLAAGWNTASVYNAAEGADVRSGIEMVSVTRDDATPASRQPRKNCNDVSWARKLISRGTAGIPRTRTLKIPSNTTFPVCVRYRSGPFCVVETCDKRQQRAGSRRRRKNAISGSGRGS